MFLYAVISRGLVAFLASVVDATSVLVVEDDIVLGALICRGLRAAGYQVAEASDGNKALESLETVNYAAVVTDIIMPDKEGVETIIEIRKRWPTTKIVAISGGGRVDPSMILNLAEHLGADAVLKKPFSLKSLLDVLKTLAPL
jgi:DNA-binding response OmpR family regulator